MIKILWKNLLKDNSFAKGIIFLVFIKEMGLDHTWKSK